MSQSTVWGSLRTPQLVALLCCNEYFMNQTGSDEWSLSDSDGSYEPSKESESQGDDVEEVESDEDPKRPFKQPKGSARNISKHEDAKKKRKSAPKSASKVCAFHLACFY